MATTIVAPQALAGGGGAAAAACSMPMLPSLQALKESMLPPSSPLFRAPSTTMPSCAAQEPPSSGGGAAATPTLPPLRAVIGNILVQQHSSSSNAAAADSSHSSAKQPPAASQQDTHCSPSPPPFARSTSYHHSSSAPSSCPATSPPSPVRSPQASAVRSGAPASHHHQESEEGCDRDSSLEEETDSNSSCTTVEDQRKVPVYTGVSRSGLNGRYRAQLSTKGKTVHLGTFSTAEEAARAWDRAAVAERGRDVLTNFDPSNYFEADGTLRQDLCASNKKEGGEERGKSKEYRGVYHSGTYGRWKARIVINGHKIHLGTFGTAAEAARAWDRKAIEHRGSGTVTNFDAAEYEKEMAAFKAKTAAEAAERGEGKDGRGDDKSSRGDDDMEETGSCGYRGIYSRSGSGKWVARLRNNKKSVYIGSYSSAKQAAQAWDLAALRERGLLTATNFDKSNYLDENGNLITSLKFEDEDKDSHAGNKRKSGTFSRPSSTQPSSGPASSTSISSTPSSASTASTASSVCNEDHGEAGSCDEEAVFADALLLLSRKKAKAD